MSPDVDYRPKPLVRTHVHAVVQSLRVALRVNEREYEEFWHVPHNAVTVADGVPDYFDWVLAGRIDSHRLNRLHRPCVALRYVPASSLNRLPGSGRSGAPLMYEFGAADPVSAVVGTVLRDMPDTCLPEVARSLGTPRYQQWLAERIGSGRVVALQEVALSDVADLSESLRTRIIDMTGRALPGSVVPGRKRFDIVVATPPPMCFALAAIEIDGREHRLGSGDSDAVKNAFCRASGLPLIRIAIGGEGGMTAAHNALQDSYLPRYAEWIVATVTDLADEAGQIGQFTGAMTAIADTAGPEVRNDLLALVSGLEQVFERLERPMMDGIDSLQNDTYEDRAGVRRSVESFVSTEARSRREGEDLYFDVYPEWHGIHAADARYETLPDPVAVGPFRVRVIANGSFRNRFLEQAERAVAREHHGHFETAVRESLGVAPSETVAAALERVNLHIAIRACRDDVGMMETVAREYLCISLPDDWDRVPAGGLPFLGTDRWIRSPPEDCIAYWSERRDRYRRRAGVLERVLRDSRSGITATDRALVQDVTTACDARWNAFDAWAAGITDTAVRQRSPGETDPPEPASGGQAPRF